jgi:hypothetical protein
MFITINLRKCAKLAQHHLHLGLTKINCVLRADFRGVPRENFKQCTRKDGQRYYEVHYTLNVTFDSAVMRFSSEMNGKEMGAVEAKYD